jgi:signal transduction histidine kinase
MTPRPGEILVVDDLPEQRLTIEAALAELGERVVSVGSGREALKYLLDHDVAVILLDVNMPDMDGFETAGLIRNRRRNATTPIIFLTADHDQMQAARGYALGAVDYLTSPFLPEILRTKVSVFVELDRANERIREEADRKIALQREQAARAAAEEQTRRMQLLGEAAATLAGSLEGEPLEDGLLEVLVPAIADEACVAVGDPAEGETATRARKAGAGTGAGAPNATECSPSLAVLARLALATGALAEDDLDAEDRPRRVSLPLLMFARTLGTLSVARGPLAPGYSREERELLRLIAERASVALDNRRLYRELQERDRRKDEFLAMLSHELRNPLGAIMAAAHLLELVGIEEEKASRACQIISRQSAYLTRMIDDLLDVSRVTMGRITLRHALVDLREVTEGTIEALRSSGRLDKHTVTLSGESVHVQADTARMEQVITNLIVNAVKYSDPGGKIVVEVAADARNATLRVRDEGIGIPPELLRTMFDLFVQGGQSLDRGQGGLGIGLTLVRRLVELQGGTVRAQSDGPGKGSTFVIELPRARAATAPARSETPEAPQAAVAAVLRVLLVDDNEDAREMMRHFFEHHAHEVHEASNGPDAIEAATRIRPDLALVDLGLPGFDGLEVARRLREDARTRDAVLIAITGYGQPEDRARSAGVGFEAHLVKPVSQERLDEVLALATRRVAAAIAAAVATPMVAEAKLEVSPTES